MISKTPRYWRKKLQNYANAESYGGGYFLKIMEQVIQWNVFESFPARLSIGNFPFWRPCIKLNDFFTEFAQSYTPLILQGDKNHPLSKSFLKLNFPRPHNLKKHTKDSRVWACYFRLLSSHTVATRVAGTINTTCVLRSIKRASVGRLGEVR